MIEPNKLREGSDFAAKLLVAGMRDAPSLSAKRAVGRALGVSIAVAASATAASTGARVLEAVATATASKVSFALVAKWSAIGFLAGTVATAGVALPTLALRQNERSQAPLVPATSYAAEVPALPRLGAPATAPSAEAAPIPVLPPPPSDRGVASRSPRRGDSTVAPVPPSASIPTHEALPSLAREVELLEGVRGRLRAGDAGGALTELDRVEPSVVSLTMEAKLLRIEGLLAQGERGRAEALALELERRYPGGPLGFRLKRLFSGR